MARLDAAGRGLVGLDAAGLAACCGDAVARINAVPRLDAVVGLMLCCGRLELLRCCGDMRLLMREGMIVEYDVMDHYIR